MITALLMATIVFQVSSTMPIIFVNGTRAIVEIRPDYIASSGATAYLCIPSRGFEKPVAFCEVASRAEWFHRLDGSIVVLIESFRFVESFTITNSGKVYPHDEPWYSDARIDKVSSRGGRVVYGVHADSEPARNAGAKRPNGKEYAIIAFDWAPKRQKWLPTVLGYE